MTTNQVLTGVGLILVLAVGSQVLASRVRIPALILLLPTGFAGLGPNLRLLHRHARRVVTRLILATELLSLARAGGKLMPVRRADTPAPQAGDIMVLLKPALVGS